MSKEMLKFLSYGWSEQHSAPTVNRHAAHVERSHSRGRCDVSVWMTLQIITHVETFSRPRWASEKRVLTSVSKVAKSV
jgi:hypothetical protein